MTIGDSAQDNVIRIGPEEIGEILRTFEGSDWTGLHLKVGEVTIAAGKHAPPPAAAVTAPPAAVAPPPAALVEPTPAARPAPTAPAAAVPAAPGKAVAIEPIDETGLVVVTAPTVGSFWIAPDPGSPPFVQVGSQVAAGDQLAIVEVMKLMNPVVADVAGEIVAITANNADMVEFGQRLFLIRPDE